MKNKKLTTKQLKELDEIQQNNAYYEFLKLKKEEKRQLELRLLEVKNLINLLERKQNGRN